MLNIVIVTFNYKKTKLIVNLFIFVKKVLTMLHQINNQHLSATFNALGAELTNLQNNERNFIWTIDEKFWNRTAPILFPIVGQLKNDSYHYNNETYNLPRHGFARNLEFEVNKINDASIIFTLKANNETKKNYPFDFELHIGYFIVDKTLKVTYQVVNKNNFEMPFSIGAHPAFAVPTNFKNYSLAFEKQEILKNYSLVNELLTNNFETITLDNKILALDYPLFEKDALIIKTLQSKKVTILENGKPYLSVAYKDFPSLGIWTKINAPFLCIEPWFGFADNYSTDGNIITKEGIIILQNNDIFNCNYTIETY